MPRQQADSGDAAEVVGSRWNQGLKLLGYVAIIVLPTIYIVAPFLIYIDDRYSASCLQVSSSSPSPSSQPSRLFSSYLPSYSSSTNSPSRGSSGSSSLEAGSLAVRSLLSFSQGELQQGPNPGQHVEAVPAQSADQLDGNFWHDFYGIWLFSFFKADHAWAPGPISCLLSWHGGVMVAHFTGRHPLFPSTACHRADWVRDWVDDRIQTCSGGLGDELGPVMVWAARTNHIDIVQTALHAGTSVDYVCSDLGPSPGYTALQIAAERGHAHIVQLLLEKGASTTHTVPLASLNKGGQTALMLAALGNHTECFDLLLPKSLSTIDHQDGHGRTASIIAADGGFLHILSELLKSGADVDRQNNVGGTALIAATRNSCLEATELLLAAGANVTVEGYARRTALFWAAANGNGWLKVVEELLQRNLDPTKEDVNGIVPGDLLPGSFVLRLLVPSWYDTEDLKSLRSLLPVPNYLERWAGLVEDEPLKLGLTLLVALTAGLSVFTWQSFECLKHIRVWLGCQPDDKVPLPEPGAMILVSRHMNLDTTRALIVRLFQAFSRVVAPMITMWVLWVPYVLAPFFLILIASLCSLGNQWRHWSPGALATQHHRSLLRPNLDLFWPNQFTLVGIYAYFLVLLLFSCSWSSFLESPLYAALPLWKRQLAMRGVIILNGVLLVQRLIAAMLVALRSLLQGIKPNFLHFFIRQKVPQVEQIETLREIRRWSRKVSATKNRRRLKSLGFRPLGPWHIRLKVFLLGLDIVTDLSSIHTFLLHRHFWFARILLCTFTVSLAMEMFEGTICKLPKVMRESYERGFMSHDLQELLDHEIGYEAVISLAVSVYGLPFAAVTLREQIMAGISILVSLYGLANFLHSKFDLRLSQKEVDLLGNPTADDDLELPPLIAKPPSPMDHCWAACQCTSESLESDSESSNGSDGALLLSEPGWTAHLHPYLRDQLSFFRACLSCQSANRRK